MFAHSLDAISAKRLRSAQGVSSQSFYHIDASMSSCYISAQWRAVTRQSRQTTSAAACRQAGPWEDLVSFITLMTDFGIKDGNVGVMRGVIWRIAPQVKIADLSHTIAPQNIAEAALILARSAPYFPPFTVHVVVVDPGVGTARRPMAGQLGSQFFVGPDNGVITYLLEEAERQNLPVKFVHINRPQYWLPEVSHVFHGRDIFSPVAAQIANGTTLDALGDPIDDPVRISVAHPERTKAGWRGQVIHIDHFGNIATNIRKEQLGDPKPLVVRLCGADIPGLYRTFGELAPGELMALYGSTGNLIVSVVNGDAAERLQAQVGDVVEVALD
jgi:S-adenosylmethionine hydrolase